MGQCPFWAPGGCRREQTIGLLWSVTPHIFDILLNFRCYLIGIIADVEKAFHQIVVARKDHNMLKFL